ncbi:MAG: hypothetical protein ABJP33_18760 [Pseudoruegeria sp.]
MQKSDEQLVHEINLRNLSDTGDLLEIKTFAAIKLSIRFVETLKVCRKDAPHSL